MLVPRNLIALVTLGVSLSLVGCAEDADSPDTAGDDAGSIDDDADDDTAEDSGTGSTDDDADDDADDDITDDDADDVVDSGADDDVDDDVVDSGADDDADDTVDAGGDDDADDTVDAGGDDDADDTVDAGGDDDTVDAGGDDEPVDTDAGDDVTADAGGDDVVVPDMAVAKFCNSLTRGEELTTMILLVGEGDAQVTFTATTGECVPADGDACTEVPSGAEVPVVLVDSSDPTYALDSGTATLDAGGEYAFYTSLQSDYPIWTGVILDADVSCSEFNYDSF